MIQRAGLSQASARPETGRTVAINTDDRARSIANHERAQWGNRGKLVGSDQVNAAR